MLNNHSLTSYIQCFVLLLISVSNQYDWNFITTKVIEYISVGNYDGSDKESYSIENLKSNESKVIS